MSLQHLAQQLAAQGRGTDDQLVHMSGKEINGLQALAQKHGGSLSVNPTTGLMEAGFLDNILPMVAGAGLMAMGVPDPWMAAALVGGGDALITGSLQKGLMAGLGAYGGAGLGQGLMSAGTSVAPAQQGISALASDTSIGAAAPAATSAATGAINPLDANAYSDSLSGTTHLAGTVPNAIPAATAAPTMAGSPLSGAEWQNAVHPVNAIQNLQNMQAGLGSLGEAGGMSNYINGMNGNALKYAGTAAAPMLMGVSPTGAPPAGSSDLQNTVRPWAYSRTPTAAPGAMGSSASPYFHETWTQGTPYVAKAGGGLLRGAAKGETLRGSLGSLHGVEKLMRYADGGGVSDLGGYSDGGQLLKGPGNGVSDDIPATIGGSQPARLADGEFVVPARIVSELGNGSTDAGAKQLYAMLDRVQKARKRTMGGNSAYAKDTKTHTMLPA